MRKIYLPLFALVISLMLVSCSQKLTLNEYVIVKPIQATTQDSLAACELQSYFEKISGTRLPVVADTATPVPREILIGLTNRTAYDSLERFGQDGFVIQTQGEKVAIYGGTRNGSLYGVYTLLEEYFGCRKYTTTAVLIPPAQVLSLPAKINNEQIPVITSRYSYTMPYDTLYVNWNKLNHSPSGKIEEFGLFVHTFDQLLPPKEHYAKHPEYYALLKGKRVTTQPCLSNPAVLEIICENLEKEITKNPAAKFWSVSANDNYGYCTCEVCAAIDAQEESPAGSVVRFANKVAARFPDKTISTLGYLYSRKAPKTKPAPNVNIMFCSIECNRDTPIAADSTSADFRRDMEAWSALTDNIFVWDYAGTFKEFMAPCPNLFVMQPNIQYFVKNHVKIFFEQCTGAMGSEFYQLRGYLAAKLMWNPDLDVDATINDFLSGYYGEAGPILRQYIDLLHKNMKDSKEPMGIFYYTIDFDKSWLSADNLRTYDTYFDRAEKAVAGDSVLLDRVRAARMPIQFSQMELSRKDPYGPEGFLEEVNGKWQVKPSWMKTLNQFIKYCKIDGITNVCEWHNTVDEYNAQMLKMAQVQQEGNLAYRKPVTTSVPMDSLRAARSGVTLPLLTDGVYGTEIWVCNWLSYYQPTFDVDIDLESVQNVKHVNSSYLQVLWESAFLPEKVEILTSIDGKTFTSAGVVTHTVTKDPFFGVKQYDVDFAPRQARYIKVRTSGLDICPTWHYYAGDDALMFIDEVVVRE